MHIYNSTGRLYQYSSTLVGTHDISSLGSFTSSRLYPHLFFPIDSSSRISTYPVYLIDNSLNVRFPRLHRICRLGLRRRTDRRAASPSGIYLAHAFAVLGHKQRHVRLLKQPVNVILFPTFGRLGATGCRNVTTVVVVVGQVGIILPSIDTRRPCGYLATFKSRTERSDSLVVRGIVVKCRERCCEAVGAWVGCLRLVCHRVERHVDGDASGEQIQRRGYLYVESS